jgi:hypothetical protein
MLFLAPDYHLLNHVTLDTEDGNTLIDHIHVFRFGVFVKSNAVLLGALGSRTPRSQR